QGIGRHPISLLDWSADVCPSDLSGLVPGGDRVRVGDLGHGHVPAVHRDVGLGSARAVVRGGEGGRVVQVGALGLVGGGDDVDRGRGPRGQGGRAVGEQIGRASCREGGPGEGAGVPLGQGGGGGHV